VTKSVKKTGRIVENRSVREEGIRSKICKIQSLLSEGLSYKEIIKRLGVSPKTIVKYGKGDPDVLCRSGMRSSRADPYRDMIIACLNEGLTKAQTVRRLEQAGYQGSQGALYDYLNKVEHTSGQEFSKSRKSDKTIKLNAFSARAEGTDYITRAGLINYLWQNDRLMDNRQKQLLFSAYPMLYEIRSCIKEFRHIFRSGNMPMLYLFIEKYVSSDIKELRSFARGLRKDIDAVENAVASYLSNGFVEGTNNKLKMVKRSMYNRCGIKLLRAKLTLNRARK